MTPRPHTPRDERGVAMLYVAFFMFSSFWLVSLALDMGKLMVTKTELQKAADAAALAAASAVDPDTGELVQDVARDRAYEFAKANWALREASERVVIDRNADVDFPTTRQVRVRVHRTAATGNAMTTIFARSLGITHLDVLADATAEVGPVKPCGPNSPFAPIEPEESFKMGCGNTYTLTWMPQKKNNHKNSVGVSTLRTDDDDHGHGHDDDGDDDEHGGGNGNEGYSRPDAVIMDYGDNCNEGACADIHGRQELLECYLKNGYGCCLEKDQQFDVHSGNELNHVDTSLEWRWHNDTDLRTNICYSDYKGNGNRVLVCPIVTIGWDDGSDGDDDGSDRGDGNHGHGNASTGPLNHNHGGFTGKAKIVGFVSFFLTKEPGHGNSNDVTGQFIKYITAGDPIEEQPGVNVVYGTRLVE